MFLPSWRGLMLRLGLGWALTSRAIPHLEEGSPLVKSHCAQTSLSVSLWGKYLHTPPKFFFSSVCFSILKSVRKLRKPLWKRQLGGWQAASTGVGMGSHFQSMGVWQGELSPAASYLLSLRAHWGSLLLYLVFSARKKTPSWSQKRNADDIQGGSRGMLSYFITVLFI